MDFSILLISAGALFYLGLMIYLANQNDLERITVQSDDPLAFGLRQRSTLVRWMLGGVVGVTLLYGLLVVQMAFLSQSADALRELDLALPPVDVRSALVHLAVSVVVAVLGFRLIVSSRFREAARKLMGVGSQYNPQSSVHLVALVLALCFVSVTIGQLVITGGLSGLAQDIEVNGVSFGALGFQTILMIAASFLGVGLAIRRDGRQALDRLALRMPDQRDVLWGVGVGLLLYVLLIIMVTFWSLLVPAEQIAEQSAASDQIAQLFNTIPLAIMLSALAAVSEEILFRGALQPIFGLGLTSLFFALVHIQYTLTPATLIIFVVAIGLGIVRQRRNTTAAIVAHFVYNFVQLALAILAARAFASG